MKELEWIFDEEELNGEPYISDVRIGDRFEFSIVSGYSYFKFITKGTIKSKNKIWGEKINKIQIGIEFDEFIDGHDGNGFFEGKEGHCWVFQAYSNSYNFNNFNAGWKYIKILKNL